MGRGVYKGINIQIAGIVKYENDDNNTDNVENDAVVSNHDDDDEKRTLNLFVLVVDICFCLFKYFC